MKVALLSREFPPNVYGGAGVHVEHLARELGQLVELQVHCFGPRHPSREPGMSVRAHRPWPALAGKADFLPALQAISVNLEMTIAASGIDIAHSHTWYANFAGHLISLAHRVPHVVTVHSLEPLRPWKREQLGGGYEISTFCERTGLEGASAIIAVSSAVALDILACYPALEPERISVIPNGVDTEDFTPLSHSALFGHYGIDQARPVVLFVGRISRQKGIGHLFSAMSLLDPSIQLVVRAGAADTPALANEVAELVSAARQSGRNVVWIEGDLARQDLVALISGANVVCSPSVYEPFGLVNVEAMACEVPVVASAVGGIPEVVHDGETGLLVHFQSVGGGNSEPVEPQRFAEDLAGAIAELVGDLGRAREMGRAGRIDAIERFSWKAIASRTVELYSKVLG